MREVPGSIPGRAHVDHDDFSSRCYDSIDHGQSDWSTAVRAMDVTLEIEIVDLKLGEDNRLSQQNEAWTRTMRSV